MPHKCRCHFLFGDGMARRNCLYSFQAKNQDVGEWEDGVFYSRHVNYYTLACWEILKMYCTCPQLAFSKCFIASFILFLSFFPAKPSRPAQPGTQPGGRALLQLTAWLCRQRGSHNSSRLTGLKLVPSLFHFTAPSRPEVFSVHLETADENSSDKTVYLPQGKNYISMYKMKGLY